MKVVLDTNVFISGIFWEGNFCSQIIDAWRKEKFTLISSLEIIEELVSTLRDFKIYMSEEMILEWKKIIIENSLIVMTSSELKIIEADPEDNKFLEAGVDGGVDYIVSQDRHLLDVGDFRGIKIVLPERFLEVLEGVV